ncbi:MFS general substrate transporter [Aulographum hederae CBS 113979]|uniref:MFS general substrate transporter n=1 Tax=Aulographum hederae CBS 113979 TaxID=1176131 RepID=A0A6G1GR34_9PEZI|nr:MFS general substrate transporter [Aulographum hederae CBS 113979]
MAPPSEHDHAPLNPKEIHIETSEKTPRESTDQHVADEKSPASRGTTSIDSVESRDNSDSIHTCDDNENHYEPAEFHDVLSKKATGVSVATNATSDPAFEIDWEDAEDQENPKNWPMWYRASIIFFISWSTMTVVMYSSSFTSGIPGLSRDFNINSPTIPVLGVTTYLIGLACGSVVLAPLSEMYGRRPIYLISMALFAILIIPVGLAQNFAAVLITRFFGAFFGSAMIGNAPGSVNDIVTEEYRALAFSIWSIGPMNGPVIGPLVGGFVFQYLGWRWTNWVVLISSGASFIMIALCKETYAPAILRKKAAKQRKETGNERYWSRYDEKAAFWPLLKVNLSRPFILTFTEPICLFWDLYIAVVYGILYLCFVAYPIVFSELRGWSPGFVGLSYCGIGVGSLIVIALEPAIRRLIKSHTPDPATGRPTPESMVSVVCIAALCIPAGELIFAWTCTPDVHWIVPIIAGIPFGMGNCTVFIYSSSYLVHSYGIYAASALAGNAVFRSILGATLPLGAPKMYETLGPHWAGTLLGLLELALAPIPFVFYRYGHRIRERSGLIRKMREDLERAEMKRRRREGRREEKGVEVRDKEVEVEA